MRYFWISFVSVFFSGLRRIWNALRGNRRHDKCLPDPLNMRMNCSISTRLGNHMMALKFLILPLNTVYFCSQTSICYQRPSIGLAVKIEERIPWSLYFTGSVFRNTWVAICRILWLGNYRKSTAQKLRRMTMDRGGAELDPNSRVKKTSRDERKNYE